jgi:hypothetical protein
MSDGVDHVAAACEEWCEGRDPSAHVHQPAACRQMFHDEFGGDGVLPQPRGVIRKEGERPLPHEAEIQEPERIRVTLDDRREGGSSEVTRVWSEQRAKDHERRDPILLSHRVALGVGCHGPQGRRQRLMEVVCRPLCMGRPLVSRDQKRSIGGLPQPGHLRPVVGGVRFVDHHVDADDELGPDGEVGEAAEEEPAVRSHCLGSPHRFG